MKIFTIYTETRPNLAAIVGTKFDGFTLVSAVGYWRGLREDSTKIEIIADAERYADVVAVAADIKVENQQEAVFITAADVDAQLITREV